jgi:hypothetical protein
VIVGNTFEAVTLNSGIGLFWGTAAGGSTPVTSLDDDNIYEALQVGIDLSANAVDVTVGHGETLISNQVAISNYQTSQTTSNNRVLAVPAYGIYTVSAAASGTTGVKLTVNAVTGLVLGQFLSCGLTGTTNLFGVFPITAFDDSTHLELGVGYANTLEATAPMFRKC